MLTNIAKVYPVLRNWPFHLTGVSFNPVTCANVHACLKKKKKKREVAVQKGRATCQCLFPLL